jgi:hypothetical protein
MMPGSARLLALAIALTPLAAPAAAADALSQAETLLFDGPHLRNTAAQGVLEYRYSRSGSLGPALDDAVSVRLGPAQTRDTRNVHVDYLSGANVFVLPDVAAASANPVILSFLERDVREMQRLTGGQAAYFRKRVRLALAESAQVRALDIDYRGARLPAWEISLRPYDDDPMRSRFAAYADKRYVFVLAEAIPGMVYELRATMADRRPAAVADESRPPLMDETLRFAGEHP